MKQWLLHKLNILILKFEKYAQDKIYNEYKRKYELHPTIRFNGKGIKLYGDEVIQIGENTNLGEFSYLQSTEDLYIKIGKNCAISHNVKIYTSSYVANQDFTNMSRSTYSKSVKIDNGVWIGANVLINPDIKIGNNVVVGANAVVIQNLPDNTICGGAPAKVLKYKTC